MIWTPTQTGQFLDHAADDLLNPLFRLIALRGLRRGEACGLRRADLDLPGRRLTVANQLCQHGYKVVQKKPKSRAGDRAIALDDTTVDLLRDHLRQQDELAARLGIAWHHSGLVFTRPDGRPLHPQAVTKRFQQLTRQAGLPPSRLHDLRHVAASIALAAGTDLKSISKLLGHSTITITADTYTEVFTQLDHTQPPPAPPSSSPCSTTGARRPEARIGTTRPSATKPTALAMSSNRAASSLDVVHTLRV